MPCSIRHVLSSYIPIKYNSHINLNALQQVYQPLTPALKACAVKTGIVYISYAVKSELA